MQLCTKSYIRSKYNISSVYKYNKCNILYVHKYEYANVYEYELIEPKKRKEQKWNQTKKHLVPIGNTNRY